MKNLKERDNMDYFAYNNKTASRSNKENDVFIVRTVVVLFKTIILDSLSFLINFR